MSKSPCICFLCRSVKTNARYTFARIFLNSCGYFQSRNAPMLKRKSKKWLLGSLRALSVRRKRLMDRSYVSIPSFQRIVCLFLVHFKKRICTREEPSTKENIILKMQGVGLDKKDMFGKSDPYIIILRRNDRGKWERCYQSEVVKKTLAPDWKPLLISLDRLCEGNLDRSHAQFILKFASDVSIGTERMAKEIQLIRTLSKLSCWNGKKGIGCASLPTSQPSHPPPPSLLPLSPNSDVIGEFITTARCLLTSSQEGKNFEVILLSFSSQKLINRSKFRRKKVYNNSGIVNVKVSISTNACSFLDYILSGTSINVIVGIDLSSQIHQSHNPMLFTEAISIAKSAAVNSEYIIAIQAVVEILQEYDSDELFPAFGFGTRIGSDGRKSHLVPLTGDPSNPNCKGVAGVLAAYSRVVSETCGSAPPNFAPLIKHVNEMARGSHDSSKYYVLLILTTGFVDDWVETQRAVIEASFLPISIIFIGVGGGKFEGTLIFCQFFWPRLCHVYAIVSEHLSFSDLQVLDQDFALLKVGQEEACRDNVQFVEMRRFLRLAADGSEEIRWNKLGLAKEVLAELPAQLSDFFIKQRLLPSNKVPYRPERTEQLADSAWYHAYMQPLHHRPSSASLSNQISLAPRQRQKLRFQEDVQKSEEKEELQNTASKSHRSLMMGKIAPAEVAETPSRQIRKLGRMRREVSFEDPSYRRHIVGSGNRQITYELTECPEEDTLTRSRHQSWRKKSDRTIPDSLSQRQPSQQRDDMVRRRQPHFF
ncbi:unnamed protein product [Hydatigera taeniaeformis]|uniref:Copine domain-containing protein n=1 Tax=Hydatigena taeniaeformis TaxID=6205 RepID=A0A158RE12_HYDTA|nr:unnamed protein product [Hydatigera taeniaeformis]